VENVRRFASRVLERYGEEIEFVVLFGSAARGDWMPASDCDVLVGLRGEDGKRLIDRIYDFSRLAEGNIEVFPYNREAWERMFGDFNLLFLEALEDGIVLHDCGGFAGMRGTFRRWRADGVVIRCDSGWRISSAEGT
jgi:predicted nucleotidyltransferase